MATSCRSCNHELKQTFCDLGMSPLANSYLSPDQLDRPEVFYPLHAYVCSNCLLVQVAEFESAEHIFDDYLYFSSFSASWLAHARRYVAEVVERLALDAHSLVMEVASNDGYLLQYVQQRGIPCVGVEPTAGTARAAREKGIESVEAFFGEAFARRFAAERRRADLVLGNNVLAHVPDINDFVAGLREVLAPGGTVTVEFPHLMQLVQQGQFDTVYHEHFSYLSLHTVRRILASHGLAVWDVQTLTTHGGSLRVWAQHAANARPVQGSVAAILRTEADAGMLEPAFYCGLQAQAERIKDDLVAFLIEARRAGKTVAGYGAAAKGNTLLNFAGARSDLLPYVVDASPHKQGRYLPGSRIPVVAEDRLRETKPDYIVILPWNLRQEIAGQLDYVREWGGRFVTAVPALQIE